MTYHDRFVSDYLDPLAVSAEFAAMVVDHPDLCRLDELPFKTHGYEGRKVEARGRQPMHVLRIAAPGAANRPAVLLMRSPHAREWINAMAVVEVARQFLENYRPDDPDARVQSIVETLQAVEVLIVPEGNPDGARLSFFDEGERLWRKNLRPAPAAGCVGVDCNRNFTEYFGEPGSSDNSCAETYHGPNALSEPESANIAHLVETERRVVFAVDAHSSGRAIFRPNKNGGTFTPSLPVPAADEAIYALLESAMLAGIRTVDGAEYATGSTSNHAGTSDEYFYFRHEIFGFDLECGTEFQPDAADAVTAALEVAEAVKALGRCAAGNGGMDIAALLERRRIRPSMPIAPPVDTDAASKSAERVAPTADSRRRYLIELTPRTDDAARECLALQERAFDTEGLTARGDLSLVASAIEVDVLRRAGYRVRILRDHG